eukprot:756078-Hanusia_phi.AAC.1
MRSRRATEEEGARPAPCFAASSPTVWPSLGPTSSSSSQLATTTDSEGHEHVSAGGRDGEDAMDEEEENEEEEEEEDEEENEEEEEERRSTLTSLKTLFCFSTYFLHKVAIDHSPHGGGDGAGELILKRDAALLKLVAVLLDKLHALADLCDVCEHKHLLHEGYAEQYE